MSIPEFSLARIPSSVGRVERNVVIIPPAPLVVPELGGNRGAAPAVQAACRRALADAWQSGLEVPSAGGETARTLALVFHETATDRTEIAGSLRAWGADVEVGEGHYLPELIGRWLIGQCCHPTQQEAPESERPQIQTFQSVAQAYDSGAAVVVVMADGPSGLAEHSPHALVAGAGAIDRWCAAIACGTPSAGVENSGSGDDNSGSGDDNSADRQLAIDTTGWQLEPLWRELAELADHLAQQYPGGVQKQTYYSQAPFGVGYHVARWQWRTAQV